MADNYLLVPMQLDAMVLNQMASNITPFLRFKMDYTKLASFESPEPEPFAGESTEQPKAGIYLHWTLPKALRHGVHKENGGTEFPLVPNRWVILRYHTSGTLDATLKAWILESDYLSTDDEAAGASPFVSPTLTSEGATPQAATLGRALRLTPDLQSLATQEHPFLRAVGPGNAAFSVFAPGVENVFSFYDSVTENDDQTEIDKAEFIYHVAGWYSDPAHDPINNSNLQWAVTSPPGSPTTYGLKWKPDTDPTVVQFPFDWIVSAEQANLPRKMLVHALLLKVAWDRDAENPPPASYPTDIQNTVKVAIGNTAIDALSAMVRLDQNNQVEADMLEAFQYGLLETFDQPGNTEALNMAIREHWFGASSGGTRWSIAARERAASDPSPAPVVTRVQKEALAALNIKQAELDRQQRILKSMQWDLFSLWWKNNWLIVNQGIRHYLIENDNNSILKWLTKQLASHAGDPWIFRAGDFLDAAGFCGRMQAASDTDHASAFLQPLLTSGTKDLLAQYTAPPNAILQTRLFDDLNALLTFPFYDPAAFDQVTLRPETQALLAQSPQQGLELVRFNRLLLEDAYPNEIRKKSLASVCNHPEGTDPGQESWTVCKVKAQQNLVAQLTSRTEAARNGVQGLLADTQELKSTNAPQYYCANDPVILITGLGRSTNFDPVDGLKCRLPSQVISWTVTGFHVYDLNDPHQFLPDAVQKLVHEGFNFYLSRTNEAFANIAVDPRQRMPEAFAAKTWAQPWVPLLLDWEVTVLKEPAYTAQQNPESHDLHRECRLNQQNWQFDGADYVWNGPRDTGGPSRSFDQTESQMILSGRTFITPQLSFTLADQIEEYVQKHKLRDANLEALLEKLETYLETFKNHDMLSQRLGGLRAMMVQRRYQANVAPFGEIKKALGDLDHGYPMPYQKFHYPQDPAVWDFAPLAGTFFVVSKLAVIDSFGRVIDLMLANYSANPQTDESSEHSDTYFYPIVGRNLKAPTAKDPVKGIRESNNATERMVQLTPRPVQDSQLLVRLLSNDGQNKDIYQDAGANPICGWVVPNHLDRSLALYAPDGAAWGELYLSLHSTDKFLPAWQPDPTNSNSPQTWDQIPNGYVKEMVQKLCSRTDDGSGFYDFLQVIDETLWTINPRGRRQDQNLSVLIGRPLAIVRAQLSLKLSGLPFRNQDWWNTFGISFDPNAMPDDGSTPHEPGAYYGAIFDYRWPVRLGSHALRNDGVIGYYVDDPNTADNTFKVFNTVNLPAGVRTDYLNQIGQDNYLMLRFTDDHITAPDPKREEVCNITMLMDPRGSIHAFTGLLPVVTLDVPAEFVTPALQKMRYVFRAGPFLTSPDELRIPLPAENKGTWSWFDYVTKATVPLAQTDDQARLPVTSPLIKEGWLNFTPNSSDGD